MNAASRPQMKVESSTLSKSVSISNTGEGLQRSAIISGKYAILDRSFPLFDEIMKTTTIPSLLYFFLILFHQLQSAVTSIWPGIDMHQYDGLDGKIMKTLVQIAYFTDLSQDATIQLVGFLVMTGVLICLLAMLAYQAIHYVQDRRFVRWTLYPTRFFLEFVPLILICPLSLYVGSLFKAIISEPTTTAIVFFAFGIFYSIILLFIQVVFSYIFSSTSYISTAPTSSWDGSYYISITVPQFIWNIGCCVISIFANYYTIIFICFKIIFTVFMVYRAFFFPLVHIKITSACTAAFIGGSGLDIIAILRLLGLEIRYYIDFITFFSLMILSTVIMEIILKRTMIKAKKNLSENILYKIEVDEDELAAMQPNSSKMTTCQDSKKRYLFSQLKIDRYQAYAKFYLRVGLAEHCDFLLDWSLIKYIIEFHDSASILCFITQVISYFPSETRLLNSFFLKAIIRPDLSFYQRFLLYQVHQIKGLRQSSASSEITDKLMELKRMTQASISSVREFWKTIPQDISVYYDIKVSTNRINALFNEAMDKWPNNVRLCEDYATFLIEAATDFTEGVKMKHRADLIEQGKNFVVDLSFRSLVRAYPMYLKRNIVDVKGRFIYKRNPSGAKSSNSTNPNSQLSTGTIDGVLDIEIEEQLAKANFNHHRARLAYQKALVDRKSMNSRNLKITALWTLCLSIIIDIFAFCYLYQIFQPRADNLQYQFQMNQMRYGYDAAMLSLVIHWFKEKGIIDDDLMHDLKNLTLAGKYSLDFNNGTLNELNKYVIFGITAMETFVQNIMFLAADGKDVYTIMDTMINPRLDGLYCEFGEAINYTSKTALTDQLSYLFFNFREVSFENQLLEWNKNNRVCEILNNVPSMAAIFSELQASMALDQTTLRDNLKKENFLLAIPITVIFFIVTEPCLLFFVYKILKEMNKLTELMRLCDDSSKLEATKYMKIDLKEEENSDYLIDTTHGQLFSGNFFYMIVFLPIIFEVVIVIVIFAITIDNNNSFLMMTSWMTLGVSRPNLMIEIVIYAALSLGIPQLNSSFLSQELAITLCQSLMTNLNEFNNQLMRGSETSESCVGFSKEFDSLNLDESCPIPTNETGVHELYKCFALDRNITLLLEFGETLLNNLNEQKFERGSTFYHMFQIVNNHMVNKAYSSAEILSNMASVAIKSFQSELAGLAFGGISVMIFAFIYFWNLLSKLDVAYEGAKQLLRRLSPPSVISNVSLLNYLLNRTTEKLDNKMTTSKSVIYTSKDAVVCLNRNETIEVVNSSITSLFGYTPEQLLGQPIATLLPTEGAEEIFEQLNLMRSGQCSLVFETSTTGITDDSTSVPIHVTLIGICDSNSTQAKSFAVIFRDESTLQRQRKAAEAAKAQSENLLFQILPRDIVSRLNAGETDISFSVPSATIIFVDIVKFSDYSAMLTPNQIMENLSTIFAKFDLLCSKYNLITKIKLIGDVYMAAAGLFTPDEPPANHASQVVQFGLDVLVALDEINGMLDSSLQVRIGINTDGPLIAGVLGTDKPLFDIIGDPINVSSRLQSTGIPGTVQISQTTYDLIREMNFNIEPRGEIVLKGKDGIHCSNFLDRIILHPKRSR
ncbi:Adenylate and Guanylate cyclase catalytic domain containing protein [Tritrichomonas foetus]|uniref:Adenylate and Guanylate cyclase catalytic domain containing protein n=1 Tax=Tritrichomonas foetus TaxID=1144522 RepID=A0A1J4JQE9_9EUKA|nr:Adenylate and Guanylate cyclase catalytic domain containing protein [Tritrichomonas foetus]|eukprot:OHS99460.1 Adenylate and Guanylate cyclase catalytic domain containing protein [Tritrichomonas foetus]